MTPKDIDPTWVEQMVIKSVKRNSGFPDTPTPDMNLYDDIGMDALDLVDCCMEIEDELIEKSGYAVYLSENVCKEVKTVGDLIQATQSII